MSQPIVVLTDFGTADPFTGIIKGVIAGIAPDSSIIDLGNEIPPGDIRRAAIMLWRACPYFPAGSIFLTVVDPGVGTSRRPIFLKTQDYTFIGPDNGVFTFVLGESFQAWELQNPRLTLQNPGTTFHGRDIFAPAAGYAVLGTPGPEFGAPVRDLKLIPAPRLESAPGKISGQTLHADRFGNVLTSIGRFAPSGDQNFDFQPWVGDSPKMQIALRKSSLSLPDGSRLPWVKTFGEIPPGKCAVILGSSGLLEIAANRQSAADLLGLHGDEPVQLNFEATNQSPAL